MVVSALNKAERNKKKAARIDEYNLDSYVSLDRCVEFLM